MTHRDFPAAATLTPAGAGISRSRRWHGFRRTRPEITKDCPVPGRGCVMTFMPHSLLVATQPARWRTSFARNTVSVVTVLADAIIIIAISLLMGATYHVTVY